MKVLYIGHYKEFGGWAQAATDQILSLDAVGIDVVCRNVTLTRDKQDVHPKLLELEKKDSSNCDFCIQHILPHHLVGTKAFKKNIAFLEAESDSIKQLAWFECLKQMDEVWVPNKDLLNSLINDASQDGWQISAKLVHHATDIEKYKKQYENMSIPKANDSFKFYYAGDLNDRKNLECISSCFHSEFDKSEDASLIIKTRKFGKSSDETKAELDNKLSHNKNLLRIYSSLDQYKKEIVIAEEIPIEQMYVLHNYCDCFLCPSHGEAWSIPSVDAMAFGNTPICSNFGGPKEFITEDENTGKLIDGHFEVCKCSDAAFPDIFTAREYWFQPCEKQIRKQMRKYYESYKKNPIVHKQKARAAGLNSVARFSHENIGKRMLEVLNES